MLDSWKEISFSNPVTPLNGRSHKVKSNRSRGIVRVGRTSRRPKILDPERRRLGREAIGEKAFQLFARHGYHATSVQEIADGAGVSVGSIFNYFETKEEILQWILETSQGEVETELFKAETELMKGEPIRDPEAFFLSIYVRYAQSILKIEQFLLLAYQETKSLSRAQRTPLFARERRVADLLVAAIRPGIEQGIFSSEALEMRAHWLIMLAHAWALRGWALHNRFTPEEYAEQLGKAAIAMLHAPNAKTVERGLRLDGAADGREKRSARVRRRSPVERMSEVDNP